ncbi:MAG: membrane protein insertase YidC, partial [Candidatus Omnitrophota bacterium]
MEKRLIFAVVLSILILLVFQRIHKPAPTVPAQPMGQISPEMQVTRQEPAQKPVQETALTQKKTPIEEKETIVQTEKQTILFTDIGGGIKQINLNEYKKDEEEFPLLMAQPGEGMFAIKSPLIPGLEKRKYETIQGDDYLEFRFVEKGLIEITKRFNYHNTKSYMDLSIKIKNLSPKNISFSYEVRGPLGLVRADKLMGRSFLESATMIDGKVMRKKAIKGTQENAGSISWTALKNRYFAVILKPFTAPRSVVLSGTPDKGIEADFKSQNYLIRPGETIEDDYLLYAGVQDINKLKVLGHDLEAIVNYGVFGGVSKTLLSVLRFFHKGTKSWGLAIILLTLLVNVILFPLTRKSVTSMHQMKKIQPHMQKLKDLHKDNPQKLNKEMMELYKQYNVNPLSGCLPLLLQMPVFIALYQGLICSVELKGASFLWIKDLARPDAVS